MRKVLVIAGLLLLTAGIASAACDKFEVAGGYKYVRVNSNGFSGSLSAITTGTGTVNFNGWDAEGVYNLACWLGGVASFSGVYSSPGGASVHVYNGVFGPRFNLFSLGPIHPFGEALFGFAEAGGGGLSQTAFGGEYGGGVDVNIGGPFAIRGRIDDENTHFASQFENSLGVAVEFVIKFGGSH